MEKTEKKTLAQKLFEIKNEISIMQKNSEGHGYTFVDEESILLRVNEKMKTLNLRLIPNFVSQTTAVFPITYENSKGQNKTDVVIHSEMTFTWEDLESGEKEINNWYMIGQQADGSQAMGSGLTYSNRYFLLKYFNVATSKDDPDTIRSQIEKDEEQRNRLLKCIRMDLIQMGELVHHLSKETKSSLNPDDVSGVVSIRNIVVHGYSTIKDDYIWDTIDNYCPSLIEQLKKII